MTRDFSTDVLICGAGAAGLTLAIDLARRGISFRLIEKMDDAFRGSRGKGLQPRTLEVFEDLGIVERIAATGGPYPPQREYAEDGTFTEQAVVQTDEPRVDEPYRVPLMIPQFLTEGTMRDRLAEFGHGVEFGCELIGFEQDDDGVTARLIGVQAPDFGLINECYAVEAQGRLRQLLPEGSIAWLAQDATAKDDNGRWLMYVWTSDGEFVNLALASEGFVTAGVTYDNDEHFAALAQSTEQAFRRNAGLWGECR